MLITSTATAEVGKAPPAPDWPAGLPAATENSDGSVTFPRAAAIAVQRRLLYLDEYPGLCQTGLDTLAALHTNELILATRACEDSCRIRLAEIEAEGLTTLHVVVGIALGLVVGGGSALMLTR